ncbi:unnamed protein product [Closterium sp. NIES-64]|nr:unnamed protein product [Closterium sp. NIES-64]
MVRGGVARVSTAVDIPLASADLPRPPAGPLLRDGGCAHGGICIRRCAEQRALPLPASSTESAAGGGAAGAGSSGGRGGRNCGDGQRCSTLLTITALFVNGDSRVDAGNNHDGSQRFLRADLPLYGMSYIEALERFSDGRLKINYLGACCCQWGFRLPSLPFPPSPPPPPPLPPLPLLPAHFPRPSLLPISPSALSGAALAAALQSPTLHQGRNASRGLYFARAESHTLDHRLLDAIHGSEGGYIVGGADSFYSRMAEQDAQAPRMGECGGRCGTGDGSSLIESLIKYPPLEEVRGLPEEIVGDEKEDMDFADVDASVEGEEDEDDGVYTVCAVGFAPM